MSLTLNTNKQKLSIGLSGTYPPLAMMAGYPAVNAVPWSDGASDTHGFFAPLNYDATTQAVINTNVTDMRASYAVDDGVYSQDEEKRFVAMNHYNEYKHLGKLIMGRQMQPVGTLTTIDTIGKGRITGFGDDKFVFVRTDGGNVKIRCAQITADNTVSLGTEVTIGAGSNGACAVLDARSNVVIAYQTTKTIKTVVVAISGTTCTAGAIHTTAITNCEVVSGVCVVDTNKIVVGYRLQTSTYPAVYASSISAGAFTDGSAVTLNSTAASWDFTYDAPVRKMSTNRCGYFVQQSSQCRVHYVSVSGTTITDNGECTLGGTVAASSRVECTNNRAVFVRQGTNATDIYSAGWGETSPTSDTISITGTQDYALRVVETGSILLIVMNNASSVYTIRFYLLGCGISGFTVSSTTRAIPVPALTSFEENTFADKAWYFHSTTTTGVALLGASMDFDINGTSVFTNKKVNAFDVVNLNEPVSGRKAYVAITNKETYDITTYPYHLIANVE